jgi:antitoxin component of RelBE/YafQ-DinJ toxin-antitoxin module
MKKTAITAFKTDPEVKTQFRTICKEQQTDPSKVLREYMVNYVSKNRSPK